MTDGLNLAGVPGLAEVPVWTDRSRLADGLGFVKKWKVYRESNPGVGMPADQTFMIQKIVEPDRHYFKIKATGEESEIALAWTRAEFVLKGEELRHFFKEKGVDWVLGLADGGLHAVGTLRQTDEAAGEWDANEE